MNIISQREFKIIEEAPRYLVSQEGRIYSTFQNKLLKQATDKDGYKFVLLTYKKGYCKPFKVHRMVVKYWAKNNDNFNKLQVNHVDGDKSNNNIVNLELVTRQQNAEHAIKNRLFYRPNQYELEDKMDVLKTRVKSGHRLSHIWREEFPNMSKTVFYRSVKKMNLSNNTTAT